MAKKKTTTSQKPTKAIELRYTLAELPSSQHRAGLAGLAFMVEWLGRQRLADRGVCQVLDLDARGLAFRVDEQGLIQLFDQVYGASHEEQRSTSEWKGQEPLRIEEETTEVEVKGKVKTTTKKCFVYPVVIPQGAFLVEWDRQADEAGNGPWVKLWRHMIWSIMRGVPAQRRPFNARADKRAKPRFDKDARDAWKALHSPDASVDLPSTYFLGAQATTSENVSFSDRARFQFLLHFWPFVAQVYVPQSIDNEGKTNNVGYAIAVPDVADLATFVEELPEALERRDGKLRGYRPADCLVDLSAEAALDFFTRLKQRLEVREGARPTMDLVVGVDVFHMAKEGNNIRVLAAGRVDPNDQLIVSYERFKGSYWSPYFRRQRLSNLIAGHPWYSGFDRVFATTPWKRTIADKYFKHDARKAFEELKMSETDTENLTPTLEGTIYKMVGMYIGRKVDKKHDLGYEKAKESGKLDERDRAREKVARDAFLAARSRTGVDFVDFFTSTVCSSPQRIKREEYDLIARALLIPTEIEKVRTLTMLALSARS